MANGLVLAVPIILAGAAATGSGVWWGTPAAQAARAESGIGAAAATGEPEPTSAAGLLFTDLSAPGQSDLYAADGSGHGRRRILETSTLSESAPEAILRGERIAVALEAPGTGDQMSFIGVSERYGLPSQISGGPADSDPTWSSDGRVVTFASRFGDVAALVTVSWPEMVESPVVQLEASGYSLAQPAYAANGRLAFVLGAEADGGELWVLGPGGNFRRLLVHPGWDDVNPSWSPDGTRLAFASGPFVASGSRHAIWLLDFASGVAGVFHSEPEFDLDRPSWSPDGQWIAFERHVPGALQAAIHRVPVVGGASEYLTSGSAPSYVVGGLAAPDAWPTLTITPTAPAGTATAGPPFPTLPPPPPTAHMFPTPGPLEPTSTGPAPTYPIPTATASPVTPTAEGQKSSAFLPALRQASPRDTE